MAGRRKHSQLEDLRPVRVSISLTEAENEALWQASQQARLPRGTYARRVVCAHLGFDPEAVTLYPMAPRRRKSR